MIVIINGAPGTGKSKVAELLNLKVSKSADKTEFGFLNKRPQKSIFEV